MKQSETVSDYNDRVQGLVSRARHAIEEKYTGTYGHTRESIIMMKPCGYLRFRRVYQGPRRLHLYFC